MRWSWRKKAATSTSAPWAIPQGDGMEPPPQWRRWATSDWVAVAVAVAEDREVVDLEPVRLEPVHVELVRLELVDRVPVDQVPQPVGLGPAQVAEGERVAAARCLAHRTPLAR